MAEKFYNIRILAICNWDGDCDNRKAFRSPLQMYTGSEQRPVLQCNQTTICHRFYDDDEQRSLANLLARHSPIGRGGLLHVPGVLN